MNSPFQLNQSGLLFMPRRWQRVAVVRWLKRIHAWTGFWGALLFLLMGTSGFLLNHRTDILKIDTGEPVEVSSIDIAVTPGQFASADAMGAWAKTELGLVADPKPARGEGPGGRGGGERSGDGAGRPGGGDRPEDRRFMGKKLPEATKWTRVFNMPDARVTVDYVPGSASVSARRDSLGALNTIKNLHKGNGLGIVWILFLDTIAGALITMSLTGFLLWTRLHGGRLLAGGIVLVSLGLAATAIGPFL